ncbi:hypothetical protein [Jeongeupia chitinilytica]|uniref:Glycine-rich protein n=1 Tax=Jeongeupia chitinilytica TaxID=1041641 RepID=A0ABQ3H1Y3_9NEIS|nr:hypothetical protein [Jeongeupia chitinilytica]GHD65488.1 hypothetical protein GCM10007350_26030 [Jeongeupia chitinilytica]
MRALTKWIAFCMASLFSAAAFAAMVAPNDIPTSDHGSGIDQSNWLQKQAGPGSNDGGSGGGRGGGGLSGGHGGM